MFFLRRTAEILSKYLPPKTEYVLFCKPTTVQAQVYQQFVGSSTIASALGSAEASLQLITILKKICNSPSLLAKTSGSSPSASAENLYGLGNIASKIPRNLLRNDASAKIRVLDSFLHT